MTTVARARPARSTRLTRDARGVVYVEFLIAFVPVFIFFLALVQLSLIAVARIVVQHAAVRGVRAAVVVLDDDPARYDDAERGNLRAGTDVDAGGEKAIGDVVGAEDERAPDAEQLHYDGARMAAIARAVHVPLAAISPGPTWLLEVLGFTDRSVGRALGYTPLARLLYGLNFHLGLTTAITFPVEPGASKFHKGEVTGDDLITVRVTHLFACSVPIAARLVCGSLRWDAKHRRLASPDGQGTDAFAELAHAPGASKHALLVLAGAPFALLRAEASLPGQEAPYLYASQRAGKGKGKGKKAP